MTSGPMHRRRSVLRLATVVVLGLGLATTTEATGAAAAPAGGPLPGQLTVNYRTDPLGIESAPHFAWVSGVSQQTAYEIRVNPLSPRGTPQPVVWDSGKVSSANDLEIAYAGPALRSRTRYQWRVQVWDGSGQAHGWSNPAWFETGLLNASDWSGQWISGRQTQDHNWTDMTETVDFTIPATGASTGVGFLFHAQPVGKTWGEGYRWQLYQPAPASTTLVSATQPGATNITVGSSSGLSVGLPITIDSGASQEQATIASVGPQGVVTLTGPLTLAHASGAAVTAASIPLLVEEVEHYNKTVNRNSEQNGTFPPSVVPTLLATVTDTQLAQAGITSTNLAGVQHRLVISYAAGTITTSIDGTTLNAITPAPGTTQPDGFNNVEKSGTIGFAAGSQVTVADASVTGSGSPNFSTNFAGGSNPFQSGDVTDAGLVSPGVVAVDSPSHDVMLPIANPAPLLRKQFRTTDHVAVTRARLYVAGGGWPMVTLNGRPATDAYLYPDRSDYGKRVLYDTFDVTSLLRPGGNVLGAQLGRGYYAYTTPDEWLWQQAPYDTGVPSMLAQLEITYADGQTQSIVSDPSWKTADGPTTFDDVYTGEKYDARLLPDGWQSNGFDDSHWADATVVNPPEGYSTRTGQPVPGQLTAQENPPVRVLQTLRPVSISKLAVPVPNTYVLDFGQIVTGWPHLSVRGKAGTTVSLDYDESLNADGTVHQGVGATFIDGRYSTSYYTLSGKGLEQWSPSFSYTGFRYVEVSGLPTAPTMADPEVTVEVARSDNPITGDVATSNALLNRILQNAKWSEWNNTVETETDTPDREKNGWTGDAQVGSLAEMLDNNDAAFNTEYLKEIVDTQTGPGPYGGTHGGGQYAFIAPNSRGEYGTDNTPGWNASYGPTPEWDAAAFVYPWQMYQQYGDTQILADLYSSQQAMMTWYANYFTAANSYEYRSFLGVYSAAGSSGTSGTIIDNLEYYWYFANYMANVAGILNRQSDQADYRALADAVEQSLISNFWSTAAGAAQGGSFVAGNIESENALALGFGIVADAINRGLLPHTAVQTVTDAIAYDVQNVANTHIYSGVEGIAPMFAALTQGGYANLAYQLATQATSPSYGFQIAQGATSMWESWNGGSLDHHYRSAIGVWYYQQLAGIQPNLNGSTVTPTDPGYTGSLADTVGYRSIQILPYIPSVAATDSVPPTNSPTTATLDHVSGSLLTVRGQVISTWSRRGDGRIDLRVTIPDNTTATVWVPTQNQTVTAPRGASSTGEQTVGANTALGGQAAQYAVYRVGSGTWEWNG